MARPIYISNPALWEQLRHTEDGKDFIPSIRRHTQRGRGILNRRKAYMIPVTKKAPIQQVNPRGGRAAESPVRSEGNHP